MNKSLLSRQKKEMYQIPLSQSNIVRRGTDLTVVATSIMVPRALTAAEELAQEGIEIEVVDPRTLSPLDDQPIIESVIKTGKALVVHEAPITGGYGGEIVARISGSEAFDYLDAPIIRVTAPNTPPPSSQVLEKAFLPNDARIMEAVKGFF